MDESLILRQEKWNGYAHRIDTASSSKRATFALTVDHALKLLGDEREGLVLDIGCGFGEIDILLAKMSKFKIIGCDVSNEAIAKARENIKNASLAHRISAEEGDVFSLCYPDHYFDIVISFGYVSAATYKGAQSEVSRVLKPGGLLVCDFINILSIYKIFDIPHIWKKIAREEGKYYNSVTQSGIAEYFSRYNLRFVSQRLFNSYPPINFLPPQSLIFFDKTIGRIVSKILGRVRLVCFQKI